MWWRQLCLDLCLPDQKINQKINCIFPLLPCHFPTSPQPPSPPFCRPFPYAYRSPAPNYTPDPSFSFLSLPTTARTRLTIHGPLPFLSLSLIFPCFIPPNPPELAPFLSSHLKTPLFILVLLSRVIINMYSM